MSYYGYYPEYVSVADQKKKAEARFKKLSKQGKLLQPIEVSRKKIVTSVLGKAWCNYLEYASGSSRLSRGRSYLRNGYLLDLKINQGKIEAIVSGSEIYHITINIPVVSKQKWDQIKCLLSKNNNFMLQLLTEDWSEELTNIICNLETGIFPNKNEFELDLKCSCMNFHYEGGICKHIATALYGAAYRLNDAPQILFLLLGIDYQELLASSTNVIKDSNKPIDNSITNNNTLEELFNINLS